jgi:hypothetical protein
MLCYNLAVMAQNPQQSDSSVKGDLRINVLETLTIEITPEQKAKLIAIAKHCGVSVEQAGSIIFEAQMEEYENLDQSIQEAVATTFEKEYKALEERIREMVSPLKKSNEELLKLVPFIKGRNIKRFSD